MHGIIEGFYGTPWSWQERGEVTAALARAGMDTYVYAPKDDPLHRERWREPYPSAELDGFAALVGSDTLRVGVAISPGLSMDPDSMEDRTQLLVKVTQLLGTGVTLIGLLFDDLDPAPGLGTRHGAVTAWLRDRLGSEVELFMVPLHYTGTTSVPYLQDLLAELPDEVPVGWTGRYVVNDAITAADAREWRAANGGRRPLLWDNTPVNDALMADHLFTGPLRGRDPDLIGEVSGYLANPMVQARASLPALLSAAAWCRGDDPESEWQGALGPNRVLMEGCDGAAPERLAAAALGGDGAALAELEAWFIDAERCDASELGAGVQPWVEQLRAEAAVGRVACQVLSADADEARRIAPLLHLMWPKVAGARAQVLGGRAALAPAFGQDEQSRWFAARESFRPGASVTARLVEAVFARLS